MTRPPNQRGGIDRRAILKTGAIIASGGLLAETATASASESQHVHVGDSTEIEDGTAMAYATTTSGGDLSSLGVYFDAAALSSVDDEEVAVPLAFPSETASGDTLDLHQFTFLQLDYLPEGHRPEGVYDVPHLDAQFFMLAQSTVEGIEAEPATYSIPEAQIPTDHIRVPTVDTTDDGTPDTPLVEEGRGEPIADPSASEHQEDGEFTHTYLYGASDPDGDGVGRVTLVEPMVTIDFATQLDTGMDAPMKTPAEYFTADEYPTSYTVEPGDDGGLSISLTDFEPFPGPGK